MLQMQSIHFLFIIFWVMIIFISWYGIVVISIMPKYYRVMRSRVLLENFLFKKMKNYFFSYIVFVIIFILSLLILGFLLSEIIVMLQEQEFILGCHDYMMGGGQQEVSQVLSEQRINVRNDDRLTEEEKIYINDVLTLAIRGEHIPDIDTKDLGTGVIIGFTVAVYICIIGFFILKVVR